MRKVKRNGLRRRDDFLVGCSGLEKTVVRDQIDAKGINIIHTTNIYLTIGGKFNVDGYMFWLHDTTNRSLY